MTDEVVVSFRSDNEDGYKVFFNSTSVGMFLVPEELKGVTTLEFSELDGLGDALGKALFGGCPSLEDLFREIRLQSRIVFEFREGAESLLGLPWEFVKHPQSGRPLSLEMPFVRRIGEGMELEPLEGRPLRVLVVISEPLTQVSFDARRFHDVIVEEARELVKEGFLQLEFLSLPSTPDLLARRLLEEAPDVIHFIGHGNVGVLLLEAEDGSECRVEAEKFHVLFKNGKLRLFILTACYSGAVPGRDMVSGTATALIQAGIPSVVAMQLPILVEEAYRMVGDLYAGFLKEPFYSLIRRLRASRFFAERSRAPSQWGVPVFYLQDKTGCLLEGISRGVGLFKKWPLPSSVYRLPEKPELFVGRKDLLVKTNEALREDRVVVLHGLSGMGKSFLARELCHWHRLRGSFPGGIIWLDLQAGGSYATVLERVRLGLHITEVSEEALRNRLGFEPTFLVLDSFQNVIDDSELAKFLGDLPKTTRVLLTTTERVDMGRTVPVWEMSAEDAFEFFRRRAEKAGWDETGSEYVSEICGELGYMPLAIELVSSQAASVPMKDLLDRVRSSLSAIATERSDLPLRHRKVEAALRVSYDPLKPQEKLVLARMSVFPSAVFHEHISQVIEIPGVVNVLVKLQKKGLVLFEGGRYRLHHMVRRFALERLDKDFRKREEYEEKFASAFLGFAHWGYEALKTEKSSAAVIMSRLEFQNFLGALQWFLRKNRLKECINFSFSLNILLNRSGMWRSATESSLLGLKAAEQKGDKKDLAGCLSNVGVNYYFIGEFDIAEDYIKRSLIIFQETGDKFGMAVSMGGLGDVELGRNNLDKAEEYYTKNLKIFEELGDRERIATATQQLGQVERKRGNLGKAEEYYNTSLKLFEEAGNKHGASVSLNGLGNVELSRKSLDKAEHYYQKGMAMVKEIGYLPGIATILGNLGRTYEERRRFQIALKYYFESAFYHHEVGSPTEESALLDIIRMYKKIGEEKFAEVVNEMPEEFRGYLEKRLGMIKENLS